MYSCANCTVHACGQEKPEKLPKNCPMLNQSLIETGFQTCQMPENRDFYITASEMEALGYCQWPRLKETIEFCHRMGYRKVGLAFCRGLRKEAKIVDDLLRRAGLQPISVICKVGGIDKERCGISPDAKLHPGQFEPMCNPVVQAMLLNEQQTQFNIALGLCVGHDSLFYRYSDAPVTTLVAKDRVTGHNPVSAIYCAEGYFRDRIL